MTLNLSSADLAAVGPEIVLSVFGLLLVLLDAFARPLRPAFPYVALAGLFSANWAGGYLGGALAPTVTGLIVQRTGSFALALTVAAVIGSVSAIAYFVLVRDPITSEQMDALAPGSQTGS